MVIVITYNDNRKKIILWLHCGKNDRAVKILLPSVNSFSKGVRNL